MRSLPLRALFGASLLASVSLGSFGCTSASEPAASAVRSPATAPAAEIVRLRTHDGDVAILAGGGGRRVTVYDADGTLVARDADLDKLRASNPQVVQILETSVASGAPHGAFLDETLYEDDTSSPAPFDPMAPAPR